MEHRVAECHARELRAAYLRGIEEAAALFDNCRDVMLAVELIPSRIRGLAPEEHDPCRHILKAHECIKPLGHSGLHVYEERVYA